MRKSQISLFKMLGTLRKLEVTRNVLKKVKFSSASIRNSWKKKIYPKISWKREKFTFSSSEDSVEYKIGLEKL